MQIFKQKNQIPLTEYHNTILIYLKIEVLVEADGFAVEVYPTLFVAEEFHVLALQYFKTFGFVRTTKGDVEEYEGNAPRFWFLDDYNV